MRTLSLIEFLTLDGVMQGFGSPDEDRDGDFEHGGWGAPYADEAMFEASAGGLGFLEKPDWTEARWPNSKTNSPANPLQAKKIGSLRGDHKLRTSYVGEASFKVTDDGVEVITEGQWRYFPG